MFIETPRQLNSVNRGLSVRVGVFVKRHIPWGSIRGNKHMVFSRWMWTPQPNDQQRNVGMRFGDSIHFNRHAPFGTDLTVGIWVQIIEQWVRI